jgi:hypothetical protein
MPSPRSGFRKEGEMQQTYTDKDGKMIAHGDRDQMPSERVHTANKQYRVIGAAYDSNEVLYIVQEEKEQT